MTTNANCKQSVGFIDRRTDRQTDERTDRVLQKNNLKSHKIFIEIDGR